MNKEKAIELDSFDRRTGHRVSSKLNICHPVALAYTESDALAKIQHIARICTDTQYKADASKALEFCQKLMERGHMSPFEHAWILIPQEEEQSLRTGKMYTGGVLPYGYESRVRSHQAEDVVAINVRDYLAVGGKLEDVSNYVTDLDHMTVRFDTSIAIARELIRHRIFSFTEKSTRYCKYEEAVPVMEPTFGTTLGGGSLENRVEVESTLMDYYLDAATGGALCYANMRMYNGTPGDARGALTLGTATTLYMTGSHENWIDLLRLRLAPSAHPEMRELMRRLVITKWPGFDKTKLKEVLEACGEQLTSMMDI